MRAFIVRPFGTKNEIDFDAVERLLIGPALERLGVSGRTTIDILRAGNIRVDMFQRLLTADLVVADLSIHNANVFYELGIRHALRDKRTFMLRSDVDRFPFDLQTDRYFTYDHGNPAASLEGLVAALRQTINSEEKDSPVFKLLPDLKAQSPSRFLVVPMDFREEVEYAAAHGRTGDLRLMSDEVRGFEWEREGWRVVGRAQFGLKAYGDARATWEAALQLDARDVEANTLLGTIYQRLGDLVLSDQALRRALESGELSVNERAEIQTLIGRNSKVKWKEEWERAPEAERRAAALRSPFLEQSAEAYAGAFGEDLNHFYSGLNALGMLVKQVELARSLPEVWAEKFETDDESERELKSREEKIGKLSAAVELSIRAARLRLEREGRRDVWAEISEADFCLLTSKRPARVTSAYRKALAGAEAFALDSARRELLVYRHLDILTENASAALSAMGLPDGDSMKDEEGEGAESPARPRHVLLFTGHVVDKPGRSSQRFPNEEEMIEAARARIKEAVEEEIRHADVVLGITGGASGGDLLFHEVCAEVGVRTHLYLALPREKFLDESVAFAGPSWVERFDALYHRLPVRVLSNSKELPRWLQEKPDYNLWRRNNLWMLHNALAAGDGVTLIALWDGETGDGPGGTGDMVSAARERGAKIVILDTKETFGLN